MLLPINRDIRLNYGQLDNALKKLGYCANKATGGQIVYRHPKQDSILAIKHSRSNEIVPEIVVASVIRNVVNTSVAEEADVNKVVAEVA